MYTNAQPKMSISADPTFQNLLEIRDSLLHLLDCKIEIASAATTASSKEYISELNEDIRTKIQHLRANTLYLAGTNNRFEDDLNTLEHEISLSPLPSPSRFGKLFNRRDKGVGLFADSTLKEKFQGHLGALVVRIEDQVEWKGEKAMLKELPLKPFLQKEEGQ